jgi:hypothetical protein
VSLIHFVMVKFGKGVVGIVKIVLKHVHRFIAQKQIYTYISFVE